MKSFKISTYNISSTRLTGKQKVTFAILADLHGLVFGKNHQTLYKAIIASQPDAVLVCGDLVVSRDTETLEAAAGLLLRICDQIPVFYALGNHEYKMLLNPETEIFYSNYEKLLTSAGICFLHNEHTSVQLKGNDFVFHGLELPVKYYHKPNSPALSLTAMEEMIGTPSQPGFHVLLAHNPKYGNTYFSWGADLILSGHYHGEIYLEIIPVSDRAMIQGGIWKLTLMPKQLVDGRFELWMPSGAQINEETGFLVSESALTLTIPSTAMRPITV